MDLVGATCNLFSVSHVCDLLRYACAFVAAVLGSEWVEVMVMSSAYCEADIFMLIW